MAAAATSRRQRQPRAVREIMKGGKLGRQRGSSSQEQPRIMKRDKLGRQGGSGSQEQPRRDIMKGDKLGRQSSPEGNHEGKPAWETRRQAPAKSRQRAVQNGNHRGRQAWETRRQAAAKSSQEQAAGAKSNPEWRS